MMDLFGFLILFGLLSYPVGLIKPRWLGGSRKRALAISSGWVVAAFIGFAVVAPKKAPEPTAEVPAAPAFTAATTATASRQDELRPLRLPSTELNPTPTARPVAPDATPVPVPDLAAEVRRRPEYLSLGFRLDQFKGRFEAEAQRSGTPLRLTQQQCGSGVIRTCNWKADAGLGVLAFSLEDKTTLREVGVLVGGGDPAAALNFMTSFFIVARTIEPRAAPDLLRDAFRALLPPNGPLADRETWVGQTRFSLVPMQGIGVMLTAIRPANRD